MPDIRTIQALRDTLVRHKRLELAFVFGAVAAGTQRADSDLDVAVLADRELTSPQKMALVGDLALATGRAVDLVDLHTVGEPQLGQVLAHGRRLLGSEEAHGRLLSRHLIDAADFLPYAQRIVAERRRAWTGRRWSESSRRCGDACRGFASASRPRWLCWQATRTFGTSSCCAFRGRSNGAPLTSGAATNDSLRRLGRATPGITPPAAPG